MQSGKSLLHLLLQQALQRHCRENVRPRQRMGDFGQRWDYKSRGGCLADQVGTGKTATMLALILSGEKLGDTLIVAPTHLINQWQQESTSKKQLLGKALQFVQDDIRYFAEKLQVWLPAVVRCAAPGCP